MKSCPSCSTDNTDSAADCWNCGTAFLSPVAVAVRPSLIPMSEPNRSESPSRVVVVNFDMPFGSMVNFMVKWAFASIPAVIILGIVIAIVILILGMIGSVLRH
jgi:hypothetical protein